MKKMSSLNKSLLGFMAKMKEKGIKDFSEEELNRAFKETTSPEICKRGVKLLQDYGLTVEKLKAEDLGEETLKKLKAKKF